MRGLPFILIAVGVLASGCLDAASPTPSADVQGLLPHVDPSPVYDAIRAQMHEVPCEAPVSLTATSGNLKGLADAKLDELGPTHSNGELDQFGDLMLDPYYNQKGFGLFDVSDPLEPKEVGFLVDPNPSTGRGSTETLDAKFTHDGKNVIMGYSDSMGIADISDPAHPKLLKAQPDPAQYTGQSHMVFPIVIKDVEYVFAFPSVTGDGMFVNKVVGSGPDARLEFVTFYDLATPAAPDQVTAPHDGYVTFDEVAGHYLLYLANSFHGVQIMNVDDPANPQSLATIAANADGTATGYAPSFYHSVQPTWIDGKRIIVTTAEVGYNTLKVFDVTSFASPKFLGQWVYDPQQPTNMQHNIQIVNGTLFEAHYGQGLFGFDLAAYVAKPTPKLTPVFHWQPENGGSFWDVLVHKGVVYTSDQGQGVHVLGYGCFTPGDETLESTG